VQYSTAYISLFWGGYKLYYRQMVAQLLINKEMCVFHNFFHYFVHPLYLPDCTASHSTVLLCWHQAPHPSSRHNFIKRWRDNVPQKCLYLHLPDCMVPKHIMNLAMKTSSLEYCSKNIYIQGTKLSAVTQECISFSKTLYNRSCISMVKIQFAISVTSCKY